MYKRKSKVERPTLPRIELPAPSYLNNSIQQMFHDRERLVKKYLEAQQMLARIEQSIAFTACPWNLGQFVNWSRSEGTYKAIIAKIAFKPTEPFYEVWVKLYYEKSKFYGRAIKIIELVSIMSAIKPEPDEIYIARLKQLAEEGIIKTASPLYSSEHPDFFKDIIRSYERGKKLVNLAPSVESWFTLVRGELKSEEKKNIKRFKKYNRKVKNKSVLDIWKE